jgi:ligand-binding sensor protein
VEHLQGIFAGILGVGAVSVNLGGEPLTEPVISNPFCKKMLENPLTRDACKESWRKITLKTKGNPGFHVCHAGLCYLRSVIKMDGNNVAWMITGQFYISQHSSEKARDEILNVAEKHQLDTEELIEAAARIPVLKTSQQQQVQMWAPKVTETVQSMLCERSDLVNRLEKIAEISAIHPSLKNNSEKGE